MGERVQEVLQLQLRLVPLLNDPVRRKADQGLHVAQWKLQRVQSVIGRLGDIALNCLGALETWHDVMRDCRGKVVEVWTLYEDHNDSRMSEGWRDPYALLREPQEPQEVWDEDGVEAWREPQASQRSRSQQGSQQRPSEQGSAQGSVYASRGGSRQDAGPPGGDGPYVEAPSSTWRVASPMLCVRSGRSQAAAVLQTKEQGELVRGYLDDEWLVLADEPGFVLAYNEESWLLEQVDGDAPLPRDTWRVVFAGSVKVRAEKRSDAEQLVLKEQGDVVRGRVDGDWLKLRGEPGYIKIFNSKHLFVERVHAVPAHFEDDGPSDEEPAEQPQEEEGFWVVVFDGVLKARSERSAKAEALSTKERGERVRGVEEDGWLRLLDEPGYLRIRNKNQALGRARPGAPSRDGGGPFRRENLNVPNPQTLNPESPQQIKTCSVKPKSLNPAARKPKTPKSEGSL